MHSLAKRSVSDVGLVIVTRQLGGDGGTGPHRADERAGAALSAMLGPFTDSDFWLVHTHPVSIRGLIGRRAQNGTPSILVEREPRGEYFNKGSPAEKKSSGSGRKGQLGTKNPGLSHPATCNPTGSISTCFYH